MERFFWLLIAACGLFSVVCAYKDWNWFMEHRKARFMSGLLGRKGARIFYALLGLALLVAGVALFALNMPLSSGSRPLP